jgi:hypothetical protein
MNPSAPLDLDWLRRRMPEREIHWLAITGSTMTVAARLSADGAASGTVVVAEEQTAGKGRAGHSWHSESAAGLYSPSPPDSLSRKPSNPSSASPPI